MHRDIKANDNKTIISEQDSSFLKQTEQYRKCYSKCKYAINVYILKWQHFETNVYSYKLLYVESNQIINTI